MPQMIKRSDRHRATAPDATRPGPSVPKRPSLLPDEAVSSAASGGAEQGAQARPAPRTTGERHAHGLVAVGPGRAGSLTDGGGYGLNPLPVQPAKIHCPPPRDDTLSRERLNSWMERATAGRLALIVAEAGFGKTTLVADWARHTSRMTAWYRLEPDDRDWLTFIRHIVASGREVDPQFAAGTLRLLAQLETGATNQQELILSLAREAAEFGTSSTRGLTLILDDYHVVDGFAETEPIVRALLERTAPGFSLVIAARSAPALAVGRLRAHGGVRTLVGSDLCFDVGETSRLFRDAYRRPLDEDVVADLWDRTEGWAALLTLVRTGLDEQGHANPRALVAHLSASHGDLYDFLAEEVLSSLPRELQHFLTRVALLTSVDVASATLVDDRPPEAVAASIAASERLGLLARPDRTSPHRFHPLVREFLEAHLTAEIGEVAVRDMHRSVAVAKEPTDWYSATWHYRASGDSSSAARVLDAAIPVIVASGQFEIVRPFLNGSAGPTDRSGALVLRSRIELERGNLPRARQLAERAAVSAEGSEMTGIALLNLTSSRARHGFDESAVALAARAMLGDLAVAERQIAEASVAVSRIQEEGSLALVSDLLSGLAVAQDRVGHIRYAGVTRVNLAVILLWQGRNREAAMVAARAEVDLSFAPTSAEMMAASAARAAALVQLGQVDELERLAALVDGAITPMARDEAALEGARLFCDYGSSARAEALASRVGESALSADGAGYLGAWAVLMASLALRRGNPAQAADYLAMTHGQLQDAAGRFRLGVVAARIAIAGGQKAEALAQVRELSRLASAQESRLEELVAVLLRGILEEDVDDAIGELLADEAHVLSTLAEELSRQLSTMGEDARDRVRREAMLRPERWASALRLIFAADASAAGLLVEIGTSEDAEAVRSAAASQKWLRPYAAQITRRLAPRVLIRDLGSVSIAIGKDGRDRTLRRKVLGLLCFVSSRPGMAATRDEALDAIWPDLSPDTAVNSLHQTIYYLRRVLEPAYKEGLSASYVAFDGDVLSLDRDLVDSMSRRCWRLVARARSGDLGAARELLETYRGAFALDFAYEEWALAYRENLHAAVLATVESGVVSAFAQGDVNLAIELAQKMLAVDPAADAVELQLLRVYKVSGRHAAAAEQYAHYAAFVRGDLGAEPPTYGDI